MSGAFSGLAPCEYDIKEFRRFIKELNELYDFKREQVELNDICYGSKIVFTMNKTGQLSLSGIIYGEGMIHSMAFVFDSDQTVIKPFIRELEAELQN